MTDYHPLIARAVEGLDRSTGEARCALYEQARHALVAQLRSNQPALLEADITKDRLALEEAIRKVEAEAARKSRSEPRAERRPRAGWTAVLPSARERLLRGWSSLKKQGIKGFRNVVGELHDLGAATAKTAQTARQTREAYEPEAPQYPPATEEPASGTHRFQPHLEAEDLNSVDYDTRQRDLELAYEPDDEPSPVQAPPTRYTSRSAAASAEEEHEGKRPSFSYGGLARLVVVPIILAGVVGGDILAMVRDYGTVPVPQPYRIEAADPAGRPRDAVSAAQILGPCSGRAKRWTAARRGGAGCADGAGRGTAHRPLRGGPERSAGPTLRRLRHLAHGNSVAGTRTRS